jgi:hypothetical protein
MLLCCSAACAARAQQREVSVPPPPKPLLPPGADDHWLESVRVARKAPTATADTRRDLLATCSRDRATGEALCNELTGFDDADCLRVCAAVYAAAHPAALKSRSGPTETSATTGPHALADAGPALSPAPDPYANALRECIRRVRDSAGAEAPACQFERPLDQMDFGQRHCDATCARLTTDYRGPNHSPE